METYTETVIAFGKTTRTIRQYDDYAEVELTRGFWTKVDLSDLPLFHWRPWMATGRHPDVYATHAGTYLHRLLRPVGKKTDHQNRDTLDNRRDNLRPASHSQNQWNQRKRKGTKFGYKGVRQYSAAGAFFAVIFYDKKQRVSGPFATARDAAMGYDKAAISAFGEFACTNEMMGLL